MKTGVRVLNFLLVFMVCGCAQTPQGGTGKNTDVELVNMVNNIGVENAILKQQTLYPYHFGADSAQLNGLGLSDFSVLARHYREHSGTLNIQRGSVANELYQARVLYVIEKLKGVGIDPQRVRIEDGFPGGDGMPSESVVKILEQASQPLSQSQGSGSSGSGSSTGTR